MQGHIFTSTVYVTDGFCKLFQFCFLTSNTNWKERKKKMFDSVTVSDVLFAQQVIQIGHDPKVLEFIFDKMVCHIFTVSY